MSGSTQSSGGPPPLIFVITAALLVGSIVCIVAAASADPLLSVWLARNGITEPPDVSTRLAFAQVYTGFVALGLGVAAVMFAILQFGWQLAERLQRPALSLRFVVQPYHPNCYLLHIRLRNSGSFTPAYYTLRIVLPDLVGAARAGLNLGPTRDGPILGGEHADWTEGQCVLSDGSSAWLLTLVGTDATRIPAGEDHEIYQMKLAPEKLIGQVFECEYTLTGERMEPKPGKATLDFRDPDVLAIAGASAHPPKIITNGPPEPPGA